ncbi:uncharacterized protein BYT42DRAFT_559797 [Radiomyces spectabilis]|uniref:uncharacterized protein n=1 Tax=Radiomyces spectabilis TaxID=64574 RepID=UPI0022209650|nr:uncharacterized protein BYT42DRAFT_559797 [Radiomyces spectabilis]KAI8388349.1 hypothetical protein BYT42DRAFT_559797 [Radiomyces spectabilis]
MPPASDMATPENTSSKPRPRRPVVRPQAKPVRNVGDVRTSELTQLKRRYQSSVRIASDNEDETVLRLAIRPSDPDFPFELEALKVQIHIPKSYPDQHCTITVMNTDIPKGFAVNLEKGYANHVATMNRETHATLVRQMDWLDRHMERLLQQPPAATVRFVSHAKSITDTQAAPPLPADFVAHVVSSSKPQHAQPKDTTTPPPPPPPTAAETPSTAASAVPVTPPVKELPVFTAEERQHAEKQRERELRQLQTRFQDSYRTIKDDKERTVIQLSILLSKESNEQTVEGHLRYTVPKLYPLMPCQIDIETRALTDAQANLVAKAFAEHVQNNKATLFEKLNWLNQRWEALSIPPSTKEIVKKSGASSSRPLKPTTSESAETAAPSKKATTTSIFDALSNDTKKNRVVIVNDPSLLLPPGVPSNDVATASLDEQNEAKGKEKETAPATESGDDAAPSEQPNTLALSAPNVRKGTEIRLLQPRFENVSLFRCTVLRLMVKCARCKNAMEIENIVPETTEQVAGSSSSQAKKPAKKERWTTCNTCSSIVGVKFWGELVHENSTCLGLLQLAGCTAFDLLPSSYIGTCSACMEDMQNAVRLGPGMQPFSMHCFACHAKMTMGLGNFEFFNINAGGERLRLDAQQMMKLKNSVGGDLTPDEAQLAKLRNKKNKHKEDFLTVGEPLPNQGTCRHFGKSKRWFRFPCCGKLYACGLCHDEQEDHPHELAKRHVCGLCSREQAITSQPAVCACGHEFDKVKTSGMFWEGGQGTRNRVLMSRKDPHKRKGAHKTESKKHERVGLTGKENRERKLEQRKQ